MIAWRLCERRWAASAFSGEGARRLGGRWNSPGSAVVYASETQALDLLEQLGHFDIHMTPPSYVLIRAEIPDDAVERLEMLPPDWPDPVDGKEWTTALGNQWLVERRSVALSVPSAIVPAERNVLLNPNHPEMAGVQVGLARDFRIDPRLLRKSLR